MSGMILVWTWEHPILVVATSCLGTPGQCGQWQEGNPLPAGVYQQATGSLQGTLTSMGWVYLSPAHIVQ